MDFSINFSRVITENYPYTQKTYKKFFDIKEIKYIPYDYIKFNNCINKIYNYAILMKNRNITQEENIELDKNINMFQSGKLTKKEKIVYFNDGTSKLIYGNKINKKINIPFSNKYKKLHWGQRKLLISEIDFLNRVNEYEKIDNIQYNIIYPGAAQGYKLIIQLEFFPNIKLYLWDPAKFDTILYISDFIRRGIPLSEFTKLGIKYSSNQLKLGKKYNGRVFINPELENKKYYEYVKNSINNFYINYNNKNGIFSDDSITYCNNLSKGKNIINLLISDIRIFINTKASDCIKYNYVKGYNNNKEFLDAYNTIMNKNYDRDMSLQKEWFNKLDCKYALLKLKLPKKSCNSTYNYLNGDVILQSWSQIDSTECRLLVKKSICTDRYKDYNINLFNSQMRYYNNIMRLTNFKNIYLYKILNGWVENENIKNCKYLYNQYKKKTLHDIWKYFIPDDKIGIDTLLETQILYDYLKNKVSFVKIYDLILMISDITQMLLNRSDFKFILIYLNDKKKNNLVNYNSIINQRQMYHKKFNERLDYNSPIYDNKFCEVI